MTQTRQWESATHFVFGTCEFGHFSPPRKHRQSNGNVPLWLNSCLRLSSLKHDNKRVCVQNAHEPSKDQINPPQPFTCRTGVPPPPQHTHIQDNLPFVLPPISSFALVTNWAFFTSRSQVWHCMLTPSPHIIQNPCGGNTMLWVVQLGSTSPWSVQRMKQDSQGNGWETNLYGHAGHDLDFDQHGENQKPTMTQVWQLKLKGRSSPLNKMRIDCASICAM